MTATQTAPGGALEAFLGALDEAIGLQQEVLAHLEASAEAVGRLDAAALAERLAGLDPLASRLADAGRRRHEARTRLAGALGWPVAEVTLGRLELALAPADAERVRRRRRRLSDLDEAVRRRHLRTAVLVGEASRLNRAILAALAPRAADARTYGTDGTPDPGDGRAMLDARL
jgi:hypothetical protein